MAIDTAVKRLRMLDFAIPIAPAMPEPDGTIAARDRAAFLWLFQEPEEPVEVVAVPVDSLTLANQRLRLRTLMNADPRVRALAHQTIRIRELP